MLDTSSSLCRMDDFLSGLKDGYRPWKYEGVSKSARDILCDDES